MDGPVEIRRLEGSHGLGLFTDVPWRLHAGRDSLWIPPLRAAVADALDVRRNPFYRRADRALFAAERDGRTVGRVAAIENRWHNDHHLDDVGFFGFFDCADDPEAAAALLRAAEGWLAERGLRSSRGPISPSMNHECGLLVDGFETPAVMMTAWNEPYLGPLIESAGYRKAQDLLGYYLAADPGAPERVLKLAERARRKAGITFRSLDVSMLEREARRILELYCEAWADNWGFVPPGWDEFWHTARELKRVLAPRYSFVADVDGEIVGFWVVAKDVNRVLRQVPSGRLWPWNVLRLLRGIPSVRNHRIILLGLKREYRNRGLMSLFAAEAARRGREHGEEGAEASWILESNAALTAPLEALGYAPYKRWRIYEREIDTTR